MVILENLGGNPLHNSLTQVRNLLSTGIQHIAKHLQIDIAPAMVGWSFNKCGWARPEYDGFVVCREVLPTLVDAWRAARMNAAAAEAADRTERALTNWKRLTKHLLLWQRVEERFELAKSAHVKPVVSFHCLHYHALRSRSGSFF